MKIGRKQQHDDWKEGTIWDWKEATAWRLEWSNNMKTGRKQQHDNWKEGTIWRLEGSNNVTTGRKQQHDEWKEVTTWRLEEPQNNNKLLWKIILPAVTWNKKHLSKQACINNMLTGGNDFGSCYIWRYVFRFFSYTVRKLVVLVTLLCISFFSISRVFFPFLGKGRPNKYYLCEVIIVFHGIYLVWGVKE